MDEQYFLVLLGQIGTSEAIQAKVGSGGVIDRTLRRSPALDERLIQALEVDQDDGRIMIRPEHERVENVLRKISLGLFVVRYNRVPAMSTIQPVNAYPYSIKDDRPLPCFIATFTERFRNKQWRHIQRGVFSYIFVRDPKSSSWVWCVMDFYRNLWGVAHLPNPKSKKVRDQPELWCDEPA